MEEALRGASASVDAVKAAAERIGDDLEPLGDAHGSAEYRRAMARVVARRAVCQAMDKGGN
jgi:carbon-monoxide dehydrogenase medium subunit